MQIAATVASAQLPYCRLKLTTEVPPTEELAKSVAEKLPELEQPLGLLLPQPLPELPPIPMQLLPGLVSLMQLQHLGARRVPVEDHKAAMLWWVALLPWEPCSETVGAPDCWH